jgi:hypothetical protein
MGSKVVGTETYGVGTAVVVDGKVAKALVSAMQDLLGDEGTCEHTVPTLATDVFLSVPREEKLPPEQPDASGAAGEAGDEHRTVLVAIAGEEMRKKTFR